MARAQVADETMLGVLSLGYHVPEQERFRLIKPDFHIQSFFVHLAQDLLVLSTGYELYFLSFSGNVVHPKLSRHAGSSGAIPFQGDLQNSRITFYRE